MKPFANFALPPALLQSLESLDFTEPTPIQAESLPVILAGRDVLARAPTGSGKTAAFGLGLLSKIDVQSAAVQALVLCPTRELADQVAAEIRRLARFIPNLKLSVMSGGISTRPQVAMLEIAPQVIVGTPGRILDLLRKEKLKLQPLKVLVLDEADRMLDMGFEEQITEIVTYAPVDRQTLLFSATYPEGIKRISSTVQRDAEEIIVTGEEVKANIEEVFFEVEPDFKIDALGVLIDRYRPESAIVFCHTKIDAKEVATELKRRGHAVLALHGDLDQRDRDEVLVRFTNGSARLLVATDVAARGLDIENLPMVISYELASDPDLHTHRIGRTGRAGNKGIALALCGAREHVRARAIEKRDAKPVNWQPLDLEKSRPGKPLAAINTTLCIDGGRRDKLRPGDLLGALTGDVGLKAADIGKINIFDTRSYVALRNEVAPEAYRRLAAGQIKGRRFRVRRIA